MGKWNCWLPKQAALPQAVAAELSAAPVGDPARQALESGIFRIIKTPIIPENILAWDLGKGETAVLAYAVSNPQWVAVLDDGMARRCARSLSLVVTGTLAIVLLAKKHGLIESAAQVMHALRSAGFRLEDSVIHEALARTVGETWQEEK